ncbi:MFS transporter [Schaalia sp. Marseille-Q2122]|uniref:MFS transporter n=1 Tax=Schaalia sp. Marseille-Q2122 TaxID=2736604 RepID=UPI00158C2DD3|nr:MFS transporter [Schaalia sp. Marseille-Q2122]
MQSSPFRALAHYRSLPTIVSWRRLLVAAAARASYAMVPLGTMSAITASTGSVALGGLATGVVSLSTAIASPFIGRWSDYSGQRRMLLIVTPLSALALASLLTAALMGWSDWRLWAACLFVGVTSLPIGSLTRARWVSHSLTPRLLATAFSYESMVDELMFVFGPVLVGLTAVVFPAAPLALAAGLVTVAGGLFAYHAPRTLVEPQAAGVDSRPSIARVLWAIAPAIIAMMAIGTLFGATQAGLTAKATALGVPGQAGVVYGAMGIGSAIMAILVVVISERVTPAMRVALPAFFAAGAMWLAGHFDSLLPVAGVLFVAGLNVGVMMVTSFTNAEKLAPAGGLAVAMTAMPAAITVGVSAGSIAGGFAASHTGPQAAFLVSAGACVIAALSALPLARRTR